MARGKRKSYLRNLEECNEALRLIGLAEVEAEKIRACCDEKIAAARREMDVAVAPQLAKIDQLSAALEAYYREHIDEVETNGRKSIELSNGKIGRRASSELKPLPKTTWAAVVERLKAAGMEEFIRVKESPDREALRAQIDAENLHVVGCRLIENDTFWWEADRTVIGIR